MILTVCAAKGAPGVSTTATVLGMVWPGQRVLLEADPSGGDAALRLRTADGGLLARQPTVRALAVDARGGSLPNSVAAYAQQTSLGLPVIAAADLRGEDFTRIAVHWPAVATACAGWPGTVLADVGRLGEDSPTGWLAAASAVVLLVGRPTVEGLYHLAAMAGVLAARLGQGPYGRPPLSVALICRPREHEARLRELAALLAADPNTAAVPVAGWLADDPRGVAALRDGLPTRRLTGSELLTSARVLAQTLLAGCPQAPDETGTAEPSAVPTATALPGVLSAPAVGAGGWL